MEPFSMLQLLLSENQFELIFPETDNATPSTIRLVYLMNDAVESFLLFHNARLTGTYDPAYEGELDALLTQDENERYALIVHQGDSVVTLFFEDLTLENHYYDYSQIGHFWMKGYEYLRQLEYRIAILRDKLDYLGEESCCAERTGTCRPRGISSIKRLLLPVGPGKIPRRPRKSLAPLRRRFARLPVHCRRSR